MTDCLFCSIVSGAIPADIVLRTDEVVAFRDINPAAPVHVLVIPVEHHATAAELGAANPTAAAAVLAAAGEVATREGIAESGYRMVFNSGAGAGQTVFHAHVHVMGGRDLTWPPG
ncbi:MAG: HIT domain-containing protein [Candidatus Nanopelagicales bacterium]|nr:HIT domain-containing protein [Candidatus Nanopelagicales bacterium]